MTLMNDCKRLTESRITPQSIEGFVASRDIAASIPAIVRGAIVLDAIVATALGLGIALDIPGLAIAAAAFLAALAAFDLIALRQRGKHAARVTAFRQGLHRALVDTGEMSTLDATTFTDTFRLDARDRRWVLMATTTEGPSLIDWTLLVNPDGSTELSRKKA